MSIAFSLNGRNVHPNYSDGISLQSKRQSGERFRRTELSEKLVFQGDDYAWIVAQPFDTKFILHMDTGTMTWDGVFWKTDCEFDADDKTCTVQPDPYDYYKAVLDGYEKEYDLVKLAPAINAINMYKRDILQVYAMSDGVGDRVLTNFLGGSPWEQDLALSYTEITETKLINDYKFTKILARFAYKVTGGYQLGQYDDTYFGSKWTSLSYGDSPLVFEGKRGVWDLHLWVTRESTGSGFNYYFNAALFGAGTSMEQVGSRWTSGASFQDTFYYDRSGYASYKTISLGFPETAAHSLGESVLFARALSGHQYSSSYIQRPAEDITEYNLNYTWIRQISTSASTEFYVSGDTQAEPTEWGKSSTGGYFVEPDDYVVPVSRSLWSPFSLWVSKMYSADISSDVTAESYTLNDAYTIESAINILLNEITGDSGKPVTFAITDSLFLNGDSPLRTGRKLFISQLSNVKKTYYQNAAQTGKTTLRQILDMLRDCFHCYWHIDSNGAMHIEHISWYMKGGTYSTDSRTPAADLTQMVHPRNFKTWDYGQNTYGFEKVSLPERIEFSFASSQTEPFNGLPIQYQSGYVKKGQIEKVSVSNFYSDVDWLISGASGTGDDGWVVIDALDSSGTYSCPIITLQLFGTGYYPQNGYMAFAYLETTFFGYDMSAPVAQYEGNYAMTCTDTVRARTQQVVFPCSAALSDFALVKTGVGTGEIDSVEYKIKSGSAQADLKLPTEDE